MGDKLPSNDELRSCGRYAFGRRLKAAEDLMVRFAELLGRSEGQGQMGPRPAIEELEAAARDLRAYTEATR